MEASRGLIACPDVKVSCLESVTLNIPILNKEEEKRLVVGSTELYIHISFCKTVNL